MGLCQPLEYLFIDFFEFPFHMCYNILNEFDDIDDDKGYPHIWMEKAFKIKILTFITASLEIIKNPIL